jgi:hypothetical protein
MMSTMCSKHVESYKKINTYKWLCASHWLFTKNHCTMHRQQNVKRLKLLFTNRRIGISFFTGSGPFRKHQAWSSIYWMIGAISTRSKRPECDDDTTVSSQVLGIHYSCIRKICRHFSSVHEISLCKWDAHVSMFTEKVEREIMCSLRDRNFFLYNCTFTSYSDLSTEY